MADQVAPPITADIIQALAKTSDDFGFEMRVGRAVRNFVHRSATNGTYLTLRQGETYIDYRTEVERHFDYQCVVSYEWRRLQLAIECKNFFADVPAVICGHRRIVTESFHDMVFAGKGTLKSGATTFVNANATEVSQVTDSAIYPHSDPTGSFVGKSVFRPKPTKDAKEARNPPLFGYTVSKDREDYDAWNQSIGSAANMVQRAMNFRQIGDLPPFHFAVTLPVMVVPDGRLWQLEFTQDGEPSGAPAQVDHVTIFRDHQIRATDSNTPPVYRRVRISHIHFLTLTGLERLLRLATTSDSTIFWEAHFPSAIAKAVTDRFRP